ncbi:DUF6588 family protein [Desertivirga brevis]|uniref:DUF6588 family protein n=1 Tax=Desertivirga brevis TaxID=2810310 RepID=UPI001A97C99B|nr:DUF6588 family protein [Pedobacter sp. SYSU D00873]
MKLSTKVSALLLVSSMAFSTSSNAQEEIGKLIAGSPEDATALTKAYLNPFFKGVGLGLNSGWTNTGSVKQLGKFEFRAGVTGAIIPGKDKSFDVSTLGLKRLRPADPNKVMAPTIAGEEMQGPTMIVLNENGQPLKNGTQNVTINLPQGINPTQSAIPAPQLQASIGLVKGFEATVRYLPPIAPPDFGEFSMIGGGIKFQPLRFASKKVNKLVPFDLAVALGWSQFKYSYDLEVKDRFGNAPDDQRIEAKFSGINAEAILSKKFLLFVPFVAVGYQTSTTDAGIKGTYEYASGYTGTSTAGVVSYSTVKDPVSINEKYINNFKASAGLTVNLLLFRVYGSYTLGAYNYVNLGLGLGFGK